MFFIWVKGGVIIKTIKVKEKTKQDIKTFDKITAWTERVKDPVVHSVDQVKDTGTGQNNPVEYGSDKIKYYSNRLADETKYAAKKSLSKGKDITTKGIKHAKKPIGIVANKVKTARSVRKTKKRVDKAKFIEKQGRNLAKKSRQAAKKGAKAVKKALVLTVRAIIKALKSLVALITLLCSLSFTAILVLMLLGMLIASILGIFFSGEQGMEGTMTMPEVVNECNKEFYDRMETIQNQHPHDALVVEGSQANWRDVLLIYASKEYKEDDEEVATIDERKRKLINNIFWEMNDFEYEVKDEKVEGHYTEVKTDMSPQMKKVLHIKIKTKTAEEMTRRYAFNSTQMKNYNELNDEQFNDLWGNIIYGMHETGDYVTWRQKGREWSNIKIGNTSASIGDIGCLVTSIAIQIERSGVSNPISNFNPGTFVEALNKNGGFNGYGALQYGPINKVVPSFKYGGKINLRDLSREEKLKKIKEYYDKGYYLTAEVLGASETAQHWVAVTGIDDTGITMIDPGSEHTSMWTAYEWRLTSQFNYFIAKK